VDWIWAGCIMMALGGILALSDRRYRIHTRKTSQATDSVMAGKTTTLAVEGKIS
jgi:cytochrome c-type biogenesis protein CcmF